ncbi:hypothetical protein L249_5939 [Ophiocordyceps polyrhachis-furcata BCC 54312]|uniref:C2H2-type domain-containing protein n=1 Tax=Ophiocordyceps polyrhachis-furcata BCC 54312 TaxID=1330021 RepID=A0A367LIT3_9HYPO|nr:hypothetical protein L249_5939 [Ophiocordyceps polyrhachis-furcata BCC 54312]
MVRRLLSKYSRRDIDRLLEEENYACGFCAEIGITKTCTRRNDLRRHIDQFHNTNAIWLCQHPGCRMAFDWQTAYQLHLRNEHGGSQMRMEEAKVTLCPQTVFACGYRGCHHLVEASSDAGASAAWRAYTAHLIKHCDEGRGAAGWDYSHRMRNLLGQPRVAGAWKAVLSSAAAASAAASAADADADADADAAAAGDGERPGLLRWDPGPSRTLRKLLETRHLDPLPRLHEMRQADLGAVRSVMPFRTVPVSDGFVHALVSFRHRPLESETSDDCRWDDVYGPAVTGSYYDVATAAGPVMTPGHHHAALLGAYGPPSSS